MGTDKHETGACAARVDAHGTRCEAVPAASRASAPPGERGPAPIGIHCIACGSEDLDASAHPRGDEPVRCRHCGAWSTYLQLEIAAIDQVRRERRRRGGG